MGALLFRHRLAVMIAAFAAALACAFLGTKLDAGAPFYARPVWSLFDARAIFLAATGALSLAAFVLRAWGEAWLGAAVYGQGETARLIDRGPFAWLRNPLYLGTWLFFAATVAMWPPWWLWIALSALFFLALHAMVIHEESLLGASLGEPYLLYLRTVPRWLPRKPATARDEAPKRAWLAAAFANLGLASMGAYRIGLALDVPARPLNAINAVLLLAWLAIIAVRRVRRR